MPRKSVLYATMGFTLAAAGFAGCNAEAPQPSVPTEVVEVEPVAPSMTDAHLAEVKEQLYDAVRDPDTYSRARRLGTLLPTLGPEAVPVVIETLEDLMVDLRGIEFELLMRFWATHQPEEATRWAVTKALRRYRIAAVYSAVATWAEDDPQTAAEIAWEWTDIEDLDSIVMIALIRGWFAANDPPELREFIRQLPGGMFRQRAIAAYLRVSLQANGADHVIRWADSLSDDDEGFKLAVHRRMIDALSALDVQAGVRWCEAHCDGPYGKNVRSIIARNWVARDGPAAMAWLSGAEDGYQKDLAVQVGYSRWAQLDREGARDWFVAQLTEGPQPWLQPMYTIYARIIAQENPVEAIRWAQKIKREGEREAVLIMVAHIWHQLDEAAANAWLAGSSLSDEARAEVQNPLPRLKFSQPSAK